MGLSDHYTVDNELSNDGVEVNIAGAVFTLAYSGSTKCKVLLQGKTQEYASTMDVGEAAIKAMRYVVAEEIVLDWRDLDEGEKGTHIMVEYSKSKLYAMMEKYVGLDYDLFEAASNIDLYQREKEEQKEKN